MLPGSIPPTSAWWARVTAKPSAVRETSVMSGRCVPPVYGSLRTYVLVRAADRARMTAATASGIAPRWTGMCSAWAISRPLPSKSAVEQSRRSLMLAEKAERIEDGAHLLGDGAESAAQNLELDVHAFVTLWSASTWDHP